MRGLRRCAPLLVALLASACRGDGADPAGPTDPEPPRVAAIEIVGGADQTFPAGRRSPAPLAIRALDEVGAPIPGARLTFTVSAGPGAELSQRLAITADDGGAETYVLSARPGESRVTAQAGAASAEFTFSVTRAPATIAFEGEVGGSALPGSQHPDSIVTVQVLDTEGEPLAGQRVWFSWPGELRVFSDISDEEGRASTVLLPSSSSSLRVSLFAFILEFPEATASTTRQFRRAASRAVLVSVNGLRADALDRWAPPTLLRLAEDGALVERARTVSPSLTLPAHLSLLASVGPEGHGIRSDVLDFTPEMASLDPLFRRARNQGARAFAFMSGEGPLQGFEEILSCRLAFGLDSLTLVDPSASAATAAAAADLADPSVDLVFLHLPDPDLAGHAHGFDSPEYGEAVLAADAALADILEEAERADSTLVVVVSDHGGGGTFGPFQHGSDADADMEIPILLHGGAARPGARLATASILDVAPTILWSLGLSVPAAYEGRILSELFR